MARRVMRAAGRAAAATLGRAGLSAGWPYPSLVLPAFTHDGTPLLLISRLAEHSRALEADNRIGLLFDGTAAVGEADAGPLGGARLSLLGRAYACQSQAESPLWRARYLARHPQAARYAGFGDFTLYRIEVERAHLVAGFGRSRWVLASELLLPAEVLANFAALEAELLAAVNNRPAGAVNLDETGCDRAGAAAVPAAPGWMVTGLDPDGCDLRRGRQNARACFDQPLTGRDALRDALAALVCRLDQAGPDAIPGVVSGDAMI